MSDEPKNIHVHIKVIIHYLHSSTSTNREQPFQEKKNKTDREQNCSKNCIPRVIQMKNW